MRTCFEIALVCSVLFGMAVFVWGLVICAAKDRKSMEFVQNPYLSQQQVDPINSVLGNTGNISARGSSPQEKLNEIIEKKRTPLR